SRISTSWPASGSDWRMLRRARQSCHVLYSRTTTISATPIEISKICKSLIESSSSRSGRLGRPLQRGVHVHGHDPRHALLLHGHPDQLPGDLHGDFVV